MKSTTVLFSAFAATCSALDITYPEGFPECGKSCIQDMLNLGEPRIRECEAEDLRCLCPNEDFSKGLRDCTVDGCGTEILPQVVAKAAEICMDFASITITAPAGAQETSPINPSGGAGDAVGAPFTTIETVITSGANTITTYVVGISSAISTATAIVTGQDGEESISLSTVFTSIVTDMPTSDAGSGDEGSESSATDGDSGTSPTEETQGESSSTDGSASGNDEENLEGSEGLGTMLTAAPDVVAAAFLAVLLL